MKTFCIVCPLGCSLNIEKQGEEYIVTGNSCPKGREFGIAEITNPTRSLTTTVKTAFKEYPVLSVRTDGEIPKDMVFKAMEVLNSFTLDRKVKCGDKIAENILETGCNIIATATME